MSIDLVTFGVFFIKIFMTEIFSHEAVHVRKGIQFHEVKKICPLNEIIYLHVTKECELLWTQIKASPL